MLETLFRPDITAQTCEHSHFSKVSPKPGSDGAFGLHLSLSTSVIYHCITGCQDAAVGRRVEELLCSQVSLARCLSSLVSENVV